MYILINVPFYSASDTENTKNDQEQDYQTIMNILLQNPEELDLKHKPSAIRDDNMFTLDRRTVSIESAKADDNGAYISKGKAKKTYWYSEDGARTAHKNENGVWYVNERWHKGYKHKYVPEHEVYEMSRQYHSSKHNPTFTRTIITIRCMTKQEINPFYMTFINGLVQRKVVLLSHVMEMLPSQQPASITGKILRFPMKWINNLHLVYQLIRSTIICRKQEQKP